MIGPMIKRFWGVISFIWFCGHIGIMLMLWTSGESIPGDVIAFLTCIGLAPYVLGKVLAFICRYTAGGITE